MITIRVAQGGLGPLIQLQGMSTSNPDGSIVYGSPLMYWDSAPVSTSSVTIDGDYFHQGYEGVGDLRDNSLWHRKVAGDILIAKSMPKRYSDYPLSRDRTSYIKAGTRKVFCSCLASRLNGGLEILPIPMQTELVLDHRLVDVGPRYAYTEVIRWEDYLISIYGYLVPTRLRYLRSDGTQVSSLPPVNAYYVQTFKDINGDIRAWGSTKQYSYYPPLETHQAYIRTISSPGYRPSAIYPYDTVDLGAPSDVLARTASFIENEDFSAVYEDLNAWHPSDFGDLALEASKSLQYVDKNVLLILEDLIQIPEAAANLAKLFTSAEWKTVLSGFLALRSGTITLRKFRKMVAPFSDLFLSWKYVYAPNIGDLSSIGRGIADAMFQDRGRRVHSRRKTEVLQPDASVKLHTATLTAEVDTFGSRDWGMLQEFVYLGKRWGMYPEVQNLWDILIYSFVVDWFIQFGDFFEQVDAYLNTENYFPVRYLILSEKAEVDIAATALVPPEYIQGTTGTVKASLYHRWITQDVPLPSVQLSAETLLSNHWVEAGFLVVQRLGRH